MEGKAKEAFKKFCQENDYSLFAESEKYKDLAIMNNALIIEWLDSVGIYIVIPTASDKADAYNIGFEGQIFIKDKPIVYNISNGLYTYNTRQEATEAAIKKAVEIYNERNP
ncbi:hypothetical protein RG089_002836 [Elizabethkingia anophelis]|nr:hypothetical protein [Elizabethkingia anophelis]ELB1894330.1 hypothetical protein [Elizabethkingia anophelis]